MARIRSIKPDFWTDEKIVELSAFARLLFIGLWNFADDDGRMVYSPKKIKMQIFPSDNLEISELVGEILRELLIDIYIVDGVEYLQIVGFAKHQKIDKRTASKLPENNRVTPILPEVPRIPTTDMEGNGRDMEEEGKGREKKKAAAFALPDWIDQSTWDLWLKTRKGKKMIPEQMQAQVDKLSKWRDAGLDHSKALADAATAGWQGLFEPKPSTNKGAQLDKDQAREGARARLFGGVENAAA